MSSDRWSRGRRGLEEFCRELLSFEVLHTLLYVEESRNRQGSESQDAEHHHEERFGEWVFSAQASLRNEGVNFLCEYSEDEGSHSRGVDLSQGGLC